MVDERRVAVRNVLAIREFRALYFAQTLSVIGDQLARVAIATLIFTRTGSALLTGASYAVSYLPWLAGGPLLAVFADRFSRRTVMIHCDIGRAAFVGLAAIPNVPIVLLLTALGLSGLLQPPFTAARAALIPDVVGEGSEYKAASTLTNTTLQLAVVAGFALGGIATSALGASRTVLIDALTFGVSAVSVATFIKARPPAVLSRTSWRREITAGAAIVFRSPRLTSLVVMSWLVVGAAISTEAAAVPYAESHGGDSTTAGLLTAALPLGIVLGALLLAKIDSDAAAERWLPLLSCGTPLALALTGLNPRPAIAGVLWFLAGVCSATTVVANRLFVVSVPREVRGRAFGVAAAGISGAQGIGTLTIGLLSTRMSPAHAVGAVSIGTLILIVLSSRHRVEPSPETAWG
jgi:MFS family permease